MKLNNIIKIYSCPCEKITGLIRTSSSEAKVDENANFTLIENVKYPCQLTVNEKTDDKCKEYTSKLILHTCDEWFDDRRYAYLCETVEGDKYLIGTAERPYPTVSVSKTHPDNGKDSQMTEVTIEWKSGKKPPRIVE